ncbi:MAG TPA: NAD(P)/FAD-dependent oxidoreductase [Nitrososphaeraceae archaeon]|nr:NAD(P)/FAD-dependent oxidoreductase [Nitrososphaeraceae archaeon]
MNKTGRSNKYSNNSDNDAINTRNETALARIDFSLKREVFFVVVGAILGAVTFGISETIFQILLGSPYYLVWIAFGHVLGVISPISTSIVAGIFIHVITSISIGIVIGIFLYKTGILNISKISNGIVYGLFAGAVVFVVFFLPVQYFILSPQIANTMIELDPEMTEIDAKQVLKNNFTTIIVGSVIMHLIFGITVGFFSSVLSIKFGTRYRCSQCDISFSRIDSYRKHKELVHGIKPIQLVRILILGGGFAGIEILKRLQKAFQDDVRIDITLVSRDNFFLFTPMLPEVTSGSIETRHIVTPIRTFCKRAKFIEASIKEINLKHKEVIVSHKIGKESRPIDQRDHALKYDYLTIALGGETNFFGNTEIAKHAFTMKTVGDAMLLRDHVINMLEQADVEYEDEELKKKLITFVVVGGGFSGVETVGELNDFIRESIRVYYHNLKENDAKIILVNSGDRLLPEVPAELADFTLRILRTNRIEVKLNVRVSGASSNSIKLNDGSIVSSHTLIWAGGVKPDPLVTKINNCEHDQKSGKVLSNSYLELKGWNNVFAVGDCAYITDPNTDKPYPPTAQHAIRQATVAADNMISDIQQRVSSSVAERSLDRKGEKIDYQTKGIMALIGKRNGVGVVFGYKVHGILAWWLWRMYYLDNLPSIEKRFRVMIDWIIDLLFKRDVTRLKVISEERNLISNQSTQAESHTI